jgi:disulfide oxidoreductase YuzD
VEEKPSKSKDVEKLKKDAKFAESMLNKTIEMQEKEIQNLKKKSEIEMEFVTKMSDKINSHLKENVEQLKNDKVRAGQKLEKELEFVTKISEGINSKLNQDISTQKEKQERLKAKLAREYENKMENRLNRRDTKKYMKIGGVVIASLIFAVSFFAIETFNYENYQVLESSYVISNLRGDTIDTWLTWRLADQTPIYVSIVNDIGYSEERIQIIKDALISDEFITVDSPNGEIVMYEGWNGALSQISADTKFNIPDRINVIESDIGAGDIVIKLTNMRNVDGFSGFTKSIADDENNQILKSEIIIYDADKLSDEELAKLVRHEFGHALGLGHSTASEDLMYPTIDMEYPFISQCNIQVLSELYDGSQESRVFCET